MLKKIFYKIVIGITLGVGIGSFHSCNYLDIDQYINDMQSLDTVFSKKETTLQYLYNVYSYLNNPGKSWDKGGSPYVLASDEAFATLMDESYPANYFAMNTYSSSMGYFDTWNTYYQGIRCASVFLKRVYECPELKAIERAEHIGEAQFLRAYYYFELMKMYGPVCIVPDEGFQLDQPISEILMARNTWDECVSFVESELKKAAVNLPAVHPSTDFGKPTSGAAYAVLSRLLLYSASPLFNGNTQYADFVNKQTGKPYINHEYQEEKWAKAAAAALKVINNTNYSLYTLADTGFSLPKNVRTNDNDYYQKWPDGAAGIDNYKSYADIFNGTLASKDNKELIFGMPGISVDKYMAPLMIHGWSSYNLPQKLADAYYMADGNTIENASPEYPYTTTPSESAVNFSEYILPGKTYGWYLNREMRFYVTVGFSGSFYKAGSASDASLRNFQAEFWKGGNNDKSKANFVNSDLVYCMTGYLCRKFQNPEDCYWSTYGQVKKKIWAEYRLAEIYLNYVEALNEMTSHKSYTIDNENVQWSAAEIQKYFNRVRHRAGLPGVSVAEASDYEKMKQLIRRERQIELAWEGHRYFDVRRWKIAEEEENGPVEGMSVYKEEEGFFEVVPVREVSYAQKVGARRKNFWPLPLDEIVKNANLDQNPGW